MNAEELVLQHYGVKGMKWGQRKSEGSTAPVAATAKSVVHPDPKKKTSIQISGGDNHPATDDALKAAVARAKLQKSGPAALSNKELQDVATRMDLERRVSTLAAAPPSRGQKLVRSLLGEGQTVGKNAARARAQQEVNNILLRKPPQKK